MPPSKEVKVLDLELNLPYFQWTTSKSPRGDPNLIAQKKFSRVEDLGGAEMAGGRPTQH